MSSESANPPKRTDNLCKALKLIGTSVDLEALPNVDLSDCDLGSDERRELVLDRQAPLGGIVTTTDCPDLDRVKQLLGMEDRLVSKKIRYPRPGRDSAPNFDAKVLVRAFESGTLTDNMLKFIRVIGRQYIYGDSRTVRQYKAIIESVYTRGSGRFDITSVCFGTIRVRNGWSLVLSPSIQLFCAHRLLLEPLARVRRTANADLSFNVSQIRVVEPELPLAIFTP